MSGNGKRGGVMTSGGRERGPAPPGGRPSGFDQAGVGGFRCPEMPAVKGFLTLPSPGPGPDPAARCSGPPSVIYCCGVKKAPAVNFTLTLHDGAGPEFRQAKKTAVKGFPGPDKKPGSARDGAQDRASVQENSRSSCGDDAPGRQEKSKSPERPINKGLCTNHLRAAA